MKLLELINTIKTKLMENTSAQAGVFHQLIQNLESSIPLIEDFRVLKKANVEAVHALMEEQRILLEQLGVKFEDELFKELARRAELTHASLEFGTIIHSSFPHTKLLESSKTVRDFMAIYANHPKLKAMLEYYLQLYGLQDKADPIEITLNGLRILTSKMALGEIQNEEKLYHYLQTSCKSLIRDLRKSIQSNVDGLEKIENVKSNQEEEQNSLDTDTTLATVKRVIQQMGKKCQDLLKQHFAQQYNVNLFPQVEVHPERVGNYVYECMENLRKRLRAELNL